MLKDRKLLTGAGVVLAALALAGCGVGANASADTPGTGSAPAEAFQPPTTGISLAATTDDNAAAQCRALLGDPNEVATKVLQAADLAYDWKASLGELVPTDRAPSRTSLGCRIIRLGTNSMEHLAVSITAGDQAAGNTEVPAPAGSEDSATTIGFKLQADAPLTRDQGLNITTWLTEAHTRLDA